MLDKIIISDIYDKNINFLIGSGASAGLFPTLALGIKNDRDEPQTIETLATLFEGDEIKKALLFMHYYATCIEPAITFKGEGLVKDSSDANVIANYEKLLLTIVNILNRRKGNIRKCNIYTTNYDTCFAVAAESLLNKNQLNFVVNDGSQGFFKKSLHIKNFNNSLFHTGISESQTSAIPQINLLHVHGSVTWRKECENILINYGTNPSLEILSVETRSKLKAFSEIIEGNGTKIRDITQIKLTKAEVNNFWKKYEKLPIVNPTKWKFHETVFEEHYYQMLRHMSYELEKRDSILIVYGFSFADEHIRKLIQRSLANPTLQVYICCYSEDAVHHMKEYFNTYVNVQYVGLKEEKLCFSKFNQLVFSIANANETSNEQAKK